MVSLERHIELIFCKTIKKTYFLSLIAIIILSSKTFYAQNQDLVALNFNDEQKTSKVSEPPQEQIEFSALSGDWWGLRTNLYKRGYEFNFTLKNDFLSSSSVGSSSGVDHLYMFDLAANFDLNELAGWSDASLYMQVIGLDGTAPELRSGAIQGISNIASPKQWRLHQLWIDKKFIDGSLSILFGLYDLNSEFDARATSALFINPSFGIGADFAGSGLNGPSIFPATSLSLRAKYNATDNLYFQFGVFDAVPGNYDEKYLAHVFLNRNDGFMFAGEVGYLESGEDVAEGFGKYSIGGWFYPQNFDDLTEVDAEGNPIRRFGNSGVYLNAEKFLCCKPGFSSIGLSVFGRLGFTNCNINTVHTFWGFGINLTGVFSNNPDEMLGLAVANACISNKFAVANSLGISDYRFNETIIELTYSFNLLEWFKIQPDIQYVINPGESIYNRAFVTGFRVEMNF